MTWKKRIISIVLCLCALLCAASVRADAEDAHSHPICGASHTDIGNHKEATCSNVTWTAWNGGDITYNNEGKAYIYLSDDVTLENAKPLTVSTNQTLYLCLNGHSIKMKYDSGYRVINVESGNLFLCDCKGGGTITQDTGNKYKDRGVCVQKKYGETTPGTFIMYGGSITGNAGGVKIDSDCTFTMCSGNITANAVDSESGGGVYVYDGTFIMHGGTISDNSANNGGGVFVGNNGEFTMQNGTITGNTAVYDGGGVYNQNTFTMSNGEISSNTATRDGGGVYGGLTMSSGKITSNKATTGGGVEAVGDAVQITGGEITGNTATNEGGGVCFYNSNLTISSAAKVANNKAAKGGGVFFQGYTASNTLTISDSAQITDNTAAENGGGIYISQNKNVKFLLSGSINISGNKKSVGENASTPNNVYLPSGYVITLTGELTNTQKIGVTTENTPSESCISITATCYDNELVSAAKDKFTYENDNSYSIVTRWNGKVLAVCDHVYDTTKWSSDETNHYHKCKNCDTTKDTTAHSYSSDWKTDNSKHWHECECGQKSGEAAHSYSSDWKTDSSKHWHECACGQKSGEAEHSYSTAWQRDDTSHFHECSACGDKKDITTCVYDQEYVSSNYRVSNATCTAKAVYRKSCVCDRAGTATFEYGEKNPNNHTGQLGDWQTNTDEHWKVYSCCQAQSDKAAHTWDEGKVTTPATCTTPGEKTYTCMVCSATKKETIPATGHAWDTEWSKDNDHHWHECNNANCDAVKDKAEHSWDEGKVTTPATCTADGVKTLTCTACSATKTERIDATGHTYNQTKVEDKYLVSVATCTAKAVYYKSCVCGATGTATFEHGEKNPNNHTGQLGDWQTNTDEHWKVYSCCQAQSDKAAHTWDEGKVTTPATCTTPGEKTYTCMVCSATKKETIPATGHAWDTEWSKDNDHHWHECNNANCDAVKDKAEHSWDEGKVTTPATCTADGVKTLTCTACSATKTERIDATGHAWDTKWSKDNDHHWHKCKNCNAIDTTSKAPHDWNSGTVTTPETCTTPGERTFTCTACSATKTETIPATGHAPGAAVCENKVTATCTTAGSYDEVVYCTACGNEVSRTKKTIDKLAHDYDTTKWVKIDNDHHGHKCKNCDAITDLTSALHRVRLRDSPGDTSRPHVGVCSGDPRHLQRRRREGTLQVHLRSDFVQERR